MNGNAIRQIQIHWDGKQFILIQSRNHIIEQYTELADIDLKIPNELKQYLKTGD